jgi:hypothetical protein
MLNHILPISKQKYIQDILDSWTLSWTIWNHQVLKISPVNPSFFRAVELAPSHGLPTSCPGLGPGRLGRRLRGAGVVAQKPSAEGGEIEVGTGAPGRWGWKKTLVKTNGKSMVKVGKKQLFLMMGC